MNVNHLFATTSLFATENPIELESQKSIEWYKNLDTNQKINLKDCFKLLCGVDFDKIGKLLSFRERICLMYNKLKMEGFEV